MKLSVEKEFSDKITKKLHKVGEVIEVDEKRGKELLGDARKLVTLIQEVETKVETKVEHPKKKKAE